MGTLRGARSLVHGQEKLGYGSPFAVPRGLYALSAGGLLFLDGNGKQTQRLQCLLRKLNAVEVRSDHFWAGHEDPSVTQKPLHRANKNQLNPGIRIAIGKVCYHKVLSYGEAYIAS